MITITVATANRNQAITPPSNSLLHVSVLLIT